MACCGIDVGDLATCVAVSDIRGVRVVLNRESDRETPTLVSFGPRTRLVGTDASASLTTNPANTISNILRLLGKQYADPALQNCVNRLPFKVVEGPRGRAAVQATYLSQPVVLLPEQLLAAVLVDSRGLAQSEVAASGGSAADAAACTQSCVLSCPVYFTESERQSLMSSARLAGLGCLRLLHSTTAAALAYACFHQADLPPPGGQQQQQQSLRPGQGPAPAPPRHLALVEFGHSALQVSIAALRQGELRVLSHAWDRDLGGGAFADVLFDHFAEEFRRKTGGLDVSKNARASFRLRMQCERVKKVLSANKQAPLDVECLMEDNDFHSSITREEFERLAAPLVVRVKAPIEQALRGAKLQASGVDVIELVGGASRIPAVTSALRDAFGGKQPCRTLHSKEVVSEGCARMAAMLLAGSRVAPSPRSPARPPPQVQVVDSQPYGISATWADMRGKPVTATLFRMGATIPSESVLLCSSKAAAVVKLAYTPEAALPRGYPRDVGYLQLGPGKPALHVQPLFRATVSLGPSGTLGPVAAAQVEGRDAPTSDGRLPPQQLRGAPKGAPVPAVLTTSPISESDMRFLETAEQAMQQTAAQALATNEVHNALEALMFDLRNRLDEPKYSSAINAAERSGIASVLDGIDSWLVSDGENAGHDDYVSRLDMLRKLKVAMETRALKGGDSNPSIAAAVVALAAAAAAVEKAAAPAPGTAATSAMSGAHMTEAHHSQGHHHHQHQQQHRQHQHLQHQQQHQQQPSLSAADRPATWHASVPAAASTGWGQGPPRPPRQLADPWSVYAVAGAPPGSVRAPEGGWLAHPQGQGHHHPGPQGGHHPGVPPWAPPGAPPGLAHHGQAQGGHHHPGPPPWVPPGAHSGFAHHGQTPAPQPPPQQPGQYPQQQQQQRLSDPWSPTFYPSPSF